MPLRLLVLAWTLAAAVPAGAARAPADDVAADEKLLREAHVATDGPGLLQFFRRRTPDVGSEARIKKLVRQLGDEEFAARERASQELAAMGPRARPALKGALSDPDPEVVRRARDCLDQIEQVAGPHDVGAAARLLALRRPPAAAGVLLAYLPTAVEDRVLAETRAALEDVAVRDGSLDAAVLAALSDPDPLRRGAAGAVVARVMPVEHLPAVRKLLADPDPRVRLEVGLALAAAREKEAVPVLIDLLDRLPPDETGTVEDLLLRLAGEGAPPEPAGGDAGSRRRNRRAWQAWWERNQGRVTAAELGQATRTLGYTLVVLLDQGEVMDLDAANRPRWKVGGLQLPLDAQLLPGEQRILVAEHDGGRVTERDLKGEIKWEYRVDEPLAAQRLPGGNTFICTRRQLLEVDREGKVLFSYTRPDGSLFMKATKLRNGDVACVLQLGVTRFVRLTRDGDDLKEARSFGVFVSTSGGRIDVLPNGNVLVPEKDNNRVVELDGVGREVRSLEVEQPIAAVRLPNGHTLVTSMTQHRAVEFDRSGKEVWQFRAETRVTRAFRR
jgi:hypothetical protein